MMVIDDDAFHRVPGLFRAFDLPQLIEAGRCWRLEDAGRTADGQPLFAIWCTEPVDA